jgi:acetyl esterase/lipase
MAKEQKTPALRFQLLMWPVTNASSTRLVPQFAEGHFLTKGMMQWFWDNYTTDPAERADPCLAAQRQRRTAQGPARRAGADRRVRRAA